ncbi:hypothetical protein CHGG_04982 [Chaetomium globosum CBS 148.51]|uniref:Alpha/beta hydrolase fold-3 domain-containing protein n=1 Tax=Chaetomium globosum (strain ATCC 6205 / CBS 148.51 / DSM 1962 / NBRC 6347 / NRRL 1970) TaxID=306901 RepID=Q2GZR4_CHAGB|nr:uncharacterized protein CHGG_04982 [Chaetomium globosum CBS 148.51]EAQ88363.1 hypothetical protein CHGG_04982 [Chaetomium globosum CBS 148.51]
MPREFITNTPPRSITKQQAMFLTDHGVKGALWVSKAAFPAPPDAALQNGVSRAIRDLGEGGEEYTMPALQAVEGEWVGYRASVKANTPEPAGLSEREKYEHLVRDRKTDMTLLYFHGGSYYLMDPVSTRPLMQKILSRTHSSIAHYPGWRLCRRKPGFRPPTDAPPTPPGCARRRNAYRHIPRRHGTAATTSRNHAELTIHGPYTLHAGRLRVTGPVGLPPPPSFSPAQSSPPCTIWPSDPPRADLLCEGSALCHPLVSPLAAPSWAGSPPLFIVCGEERLADECKAFAQKAARDGVRVVWEQYEAMPHCFSQVLEGSVESEACFASWAGFVRMVTEKPGEVVTGGEFITVRTLERTPVDVYNLLDMSQEDILDCMQRERQAIVERFTQSMA